MAKASERDKARQREHFRTNRADYYARMEEWRLRKRIEYIAELGSQCVKCGEDDPIVLDFDHIHNDPDKNQSGRRVCIIRYFSKHGVDTKRFQLLCKNCNWIKEYKRRKNAQRK